MAEGICSPEKMRKVLLKIVETWNIRKQIHRSLDLHDFYTDCNYGIHHHQTVTTIWGVNMFYFFQVSKGRKSKVFLFFTMANHHFSMVNHYVLRILPW